MLFLLSNNMLLLTSISLVLGAIALSIRYPNPLHRSSFCMYSSFRQMCILMLTLTASAYGIGGDNMWYSLGGIVYIGLGSFMVPLVRKNMGVGNLGSYVKKHYGLGVQLATAIVSLLYISIKLSIFTACIMHHMSIVLKTDISTALWFMIGASVMGVFFYLQGTLLLQAFLGLTAVITLVFVGKWGVFVRDYSTFWTGFVPSITFKDSLFDLLAAIPMTHLLAGHLFFLPAPKKTLRKSFRVSFLLSLATWTLLYVLRVQMKTNLGDSYVQLYNLGVGLGYIFLATHLFYIGGSLLTNGIIKFISPNKRSHKLLSISVVAWSIISLTTCHHISIKPLTQLTRQLVILLTPLQIVFIADLLGFTPNKKVLYTTLGTSLTSYLLGLVIIGLPISSSLVVSIVASLIGFGLMHYKVYKRFDFVKRSWWETKRLQGYLSKWKGSGELVKKTLFFPYYLGKTSRNSMLSYGSHPFIFGLFFCITGYLLPFNPLYHKVASYKPLLVIQGIGFILSILLMLYPFWPKRLVDYFSLYWHMTLLYCLPFSASLTYLLVQGSNTALIHLAISTVLLASLVDVGCFVLFNIVGIGLALVVSNYLQLAPHTLSRLKDLHLLYPLIYTYTISSLVGIVFLRRGKQERQKTNLVLKTFCRKVVHKITNMVGLSKSHATVLDFCQKSMKTSLRQDEQVVDIQIDKASYEMMNETIRLLNEENTTTYKMLKSMTMPIKSKIVADEFKNYSVGACIQAGVEAYNEQYDSARQIALDLSEDFRFFGSDKHLKQVVFELLENSHLHGSKETSISIHLKKNTIYYQDNGPGIDPIHLPYIFEDFYATDQSIGMGLAYVRKVIKAFRGNVKCLSSHNVKDKTYTIFEITLPASS